VSRLYNRSGWAVVYPSKLVFGAAVAIVGNSGIVAMLVPIWFRLQSAVVGAFETIVAAVGGFAIMVSEAVVCAVARFSRRRRFFSAFFEIVLAAGCVDSGDATCTVRTGVITVLLFASRVITAALNALSVSSISAGNGIPSSLGQSLCNRQLFSSICARVTVSGSHQFGAVTAVVTVAGAVGIGSTVALCRSQARSFFAAFFQISSMLTKTGSCCAQRSQTETKCGQCVVDSKQ
jgi:hypothetical protein